MRLQKEMYSYAVCETDSFFGILELLGSLIEAKQSLPVWVFMCKLCLKEF